MTETIGIENWRTRVRAFLRDCEQGAPDTQAQRLREAVAILSAEPEQRSAFTRAGLDMAILDGLIECGAFESAALAIIGEGTAFMLSRSGDNRCLATIADHGVEATAEGATLALALLAAYAGALLAGAGGSARPHEPPPANPATRIH